MDTQPQMQSNTKQLLNEVRLLAIEAMVNEADNIIYHDSNFANRVIENVENISTTDRIGPEDTDIVKICIWLYTATFGKVSREVQSQQEYVVDFLTYVENNYPPFLKQHGASDELADTVVNILRFSWGENPAGNIREGLFMDAIITDLIEDSGKERVVKFYKEMILSEVELSITKFYDIVIERLINYRAFTSYGKKNITPKVIKLIKKLKSQKKKQEKQQHLVVQKQLGISDEEIKKLRKNFQTVKGKDIRGVQTLFRTTSKNHYTLNEMVDRKASIMITVNSIILSIAISGVLRRLNIISGIQEIDIPMMILSTSSLISIIFAIISIRPSNTQGKFTEDEIRKKEGNLLYYGNYHKMDFKDYEWGMLQKLNDSDFLYRSLIRDLYFLGKNLHKKYTFIRISLTVFVVGMIISFIVSLLYRM